MPITHYRVDDQQRRRIDILLARLGAVVNGQQITDVEQAAAWLYVLAAEPFATMPQATVQARRAFVVERMVTAACKAIEEVATLDDATVVRLAGIRTTCQS